MYCITITIADLDVYNDLHVNSLQSSHCSIRCDDIYVTVILTGNDILTSSTHMAQLIYIYIDWI